MIFNVFSKAAAAQVATLEAMDLDCAISQARNEAQLFDRDPDDLIVIRDLDPQPHAERDRFRLRLVGRRRGRRI